MDCNCVERFDADAKRFPEGEWSHYHDCEYVRKRMELAKQAEENVLRLHGYNMPGARFTRLFSQEMERLAKQEKLI